MEISVHHASYLNGENASQLMCHGYGSAVFSSEKAPLPLSLSFLVCSDVRMPFFAESWVSVIASPCCINI